MTRKLRESDKKIVAHSQEWKCRKCTKLLPSTYQVDHVVPYSISSNDERDNLEALCPSCHSLKTQKEQFRITKFRKLSSYRKEVLCWFCLEPLHTSHECDKKLAPINFEKKSVKKEGKKENWDNFLFVGGGEKYGEIRKEEDNVLSIIISPGIIYVNNYFTDLIESTPEEICRAVFNATRSKKESKKYEVVEVEVRTTSFMKFGDYKEFDEDGLIDFLEENLRENLTRRIFKNNEEEYIFLIE